MSRHEHFEELGALAAIGQVTAEEDKELSAHLSECSSCREAYADYVRVLHQQLPTAEPRRWKLADGVFRLGGNGELRERFFARARAEGIDLSEQAGRLNGKPLAGAWSRFSWRYAMTAVAILLISVCFVIAGRSYRIVPRSAVPDTRLADLAAERDSFQSQLTAALQSIDSKSAELQKRMKEQNAASTATLLALQKQMEEAGREAERLNAALQSAQQEKTALASTSQQHETLIADLKSQLEKVRLADADNIAALVVQQARIKELTEALQAENEKVERERQLSAVSQDVRKLMGARNLHIIDVHDVDGGGKSAKSFGRVFYTEGDSLVFYAFDLPNGKLTNAKYYFQAWGEREATTQSPRNLGVFQVDDHEQRRWVLKVNDSQLLRGIDAVFVTAEATASTAEPRGKKLLYAYLGGQANHP